MLSLGFRWQAFVGFEDFDSAARTEPIFPASVRDREAGLLYGLEKRHAARDANRLIGGKESNHAIHPPSIGFAPRLSDRLVV